MKLQLTVRLDPAVLEAAKLQAKRQQMSVSAVVADAAAEQLLGPPATDPEAKVLTALERVSNQLNKLSRRHHAEAAIAKEMLGLFIRAYFNHTPAVPDSALNAALLSGKARYERFLDALAKNLRKGQSITGELGATSEPESKVDISDPPGVGSSPSQTSSSDTPITKPPTPGPTAAPAASSPQPASSAAIPGLFDIRRSSP